MREVDPAAAKLVDQRHQAHVELSRWHPPVGVGPPCGSDRPADPAPVLTDPHIAIVAHAQRGVDVCGQHRDVPAERLDHDQAECIDVERGAGAPAAHLGGQITEIGELMPRVMGQDPGEAGVAHHHPAVGGDEQVGRVEAPVHQVALTQKCQRPRGVHRHRRRLSGRQAPAGPHDRPQRPRHQLGHHEQFPRLTPGDHPQHVGVIHRRGRPQHMAESTHETHVAGERAGEQLDRHLVAGDEVERGEDEG